MERKTKNNLLEKIEGFVSQFNELQNTPTKRHIKLQIEKQQIDAFKLIMENQSKISSQIIRKEKRQTAINQSRQKASSQNKVTTQNVDSDKQMVAEQKQIDDFEIQNSQQDQENQNKMEILQENNDDEYRKKTRMIYSVKTKEEALKYYENNTLLQTSLFYNIPEQTIKNWSLKVANGDNLKDQREFNQRPLKYQNVEEKLILEIIELRKKELPVSLNKLIQLSKTIAKDLNQVEFKGSLTWIYRFIEKQKLSLKRISTGSKIEYEQLQRRVFQYINNLKEEKYFQKYDIILNMDESPYFYTNQTIYTYDFQDQKRISIKESGQDKQKISVCITVGISTRDGKAIKIKPYLIFKNKSQNPSTIKKLQSEYQGKCVIDFTASGWQNSSTMQRYCDFLIQQIRLTQPQNFRKTLLVMDSYKCHTEITIINQLQANDIDVLIIPGGATSLLQPIDVSLIKSMKVALKNNYTEWQMQSNQNQIPSKQLFIKWILQTMDDLNDKVIERSFECTGLTDVFDNLSIQLLSTNLLDLFYDFKSGLQTFLNEQLENVINPYEDEYQLEIQDLFFNELIIDDIHDYLQK